MVFVEKIPYQRSVRLGVFKVRIFGSSKVIVEGSIHKYWNDRTNDSDFAHSQLCLAINNLAEELGFDPKQAIVEKIEVGVNLVDLPFDTLQLCRAFKSYKGKRPNDMIPIGTADSILGVKFILQQFIVKAYNKALQYNLVKRIFRFELKSNRMRFFLSELSKNGFILPYLTLNDLLSYDIVKILSHKLLSVFDHIIIDDFRVDIKSVDKKHLSLVQNGRNSDYWAELMARNPHQYHKEKNKFYKLLERESGDNIHTLIRDQINNKVQLLLNK